MTVSQRKALNILKNTSYEKGKTARYFALEMWPDSNMHTKVKNTGNGATTGKGAWLCAGSYLAKLIKKGWVSRPHNDFFTFCITSEGRKQITK